MSKRYRLLKDVLNHTTGHIISVGEEFKWEEDIRRYHSKGGWYMCKEAIENKEWFEEVVDRIEVENIGTRFWVSGVEYVPISKLEDAFNAARAVRPLPFDNKVYPTFNDYLLALKSIQP